MIGPSWTAGDVDKLREWAREGLSTRQISQRFHGRYSRPAIIGKCAREHIELGRMTNGKPRPGFFTGEPKPEPPQPVYIIPPRTKPRTDGLCANHERTGCRHPAQKGYRHGLCAECNHKRLASVPRERANMTDDEGTRSIGVQRYG